LTDAQLEALVARARDISGDAAAIRSIRQFRIER
jgi:hypothetical protein